MSLYFLPSPRIWFWRLLRRYDSLDKRVSGSHSHLIDADLQLINLWLSRQDRYVRWSSMRRKNRVVSREVLCVTDKRANRKHVGQVYNSVVTFTIVDHFDRDNRTSRSRIYCYFKLFLGQVSQPWRITISLSGCITFAIKRRLTSERLPPCVQYH